MSSAFTTANISSADDTTWPSTVQVTSAEAGFMPRAFSSLALMMNGASRDGAMVTYRFSDYPEVAVKFFAHPCTEEYVLGQPWPALQRR